MYIYMYLYIHSFIHLHITVQSGVSLLREDGILTPPPPAAHQHGLSVRLSNVMLAIREHSFRPSSCPTSKYVKII